MKINFTFEHTSFLGDHGGIEGKGSSYLPLRHQSSAVLKGPELEGFFSELIETARCSVFAVRLEKGKQLKVQERRSCSWSGAGRWLVRCSLSFIFLIYFFWGLNKGWVKFLCIPAKD